MSAINAENEQFARSFENDGWKAPGVPAPLPDIESDPEPSPEPRHSIPEDNFIPPDRFSELSEQFPEVAQELKRRKRETETLLKQLERRETMLSETHQRVLESSSNKPKDQGDEWAAYKDDQLHDYLDTVDKLQAAAVANPDNEGIQSEMSKIQPKHVRAVREELSKRAVRSELRPFKEEQAKAQRVNVLARTAESMIAEQFGPRALMDNNPDSPLSRARVAMEDVASKFGITDENPEAVSALAVMAMRLAHAEQAATRAGGGRPVPPGLTRQLELEGTARRSASAHSERSAMERRGDWDGVLLNDITRMLNNM